MSSARADVAIVGAGIVGAACAYELARAGLDVCVVERGAIGSGTTAAGEGNILLSDKTPGPELELAMLSARRWRELGDELEVDFELEAKGGLVCAPDVDGLTAMREFAGEQGRAGVATEDVSGERLWELEPALARTLAGGIFYPGDLQVQPMRAAAALLAAARRHRARVLTRTQVREITRDAAGAVTGLRTATGSIAARVVVNAAGVWSAALADLVGSWVPVVPRRGVILVTEPLPPTVFHKVYATGYMGDVATDSAELQVSTVIEGTQSGTILIGASRELVGFENRVPSAVLRRLAGAAVALFPALARVRVMRSYCGFRPFSPDHLPIIGPDPEVGGLWHACGHEGAGIGLAPATASMVRAGVTRTAPPMDPAPFVPGRFAKAA